MICKFGLYKKELNKIFKSGRFLGPLLCTQICSSFHRFSIGFKSGDWLGCSSSCISSSRRVPFVFHFFTELSKCCAANYKEASTCFSLSYRALCGEHACQLQHWRALPAVQLNPLIPGPESSTRIIHGAPGRGRFMVKCFLLPDYSPSQCSLEQV